MTISGEETSYDFEILSADRSGNPWAEVVRKLRQDKTAMIGLLVFVIICLACVMAPLLTKWEYSSINTDYTLAPPSREHIMGTDNIGRDVFSRMLYGGRSTLRIAAGSSVIALIAGSALGLAAGYFGRGVDYIISPVLDVFAAVPILLLVIVFENALGWGQGNFMYAMAIAAVPQFARLVRASVLSIMESGYIEAARCLGIGHLKIIFKHILHNSAPPIIVRFTTCLAEAIVMCTIMGYIGIGVTPPKPEWGRIVFTGKAHFRLHPHLIIIPCIVIIVTIVSISLFGDGLRSALDPMDEVTAD
ncbi:MAG: ABC transporter permease [Oscillospiraceae bacterium]|nr:ABC transporter permease [Oscillospiraceae bacterium]